MTTGISSYHSARLDPPSLHMSRAGDCKDYCYSLRAWRYPAAYFRQLQNTLLMRFAPDIVASAFARIRHGRTLGLYVDGDISSVSELDFWFRMLADRPDIARTVTLSRGKYFSSTGRVANELRAKPLEWFYLRGGNENAHAWPTGNPRGVYRGPHGASVLATPSSALHRERITKTSGTRPAPDASGQNRVFSCTGRCGTCAQGSHACGDNSRFRGVMIAIGVH